MLAINLHDEPPESLVRFALRVTLNIDAQDIHDIDHVVLLGTVDAEHSVDLGGQLVHIDMLEESDEPDEDRTVCWGVTEHINYGGLDCLDLLIRHAEVDHEEQASGTGGWQRVVILGGGVVEGLVLDTELEAGVLGHELVGQLVGADGLGVGAR